MDMVKVREEARVMGPVLGDVKRTRRGNVIPDILTPPTYTFLIKRLMPSPVWSGHQVLKSKSGLYVYKHQPIAIYLKAYNMMHAVRLVDGPERRDDGGHYVEGGVYERLVDRAWVGFSFKSRPWREYIGEHLGFKLVEGDWVELTVDLVGDGRG